MKPPIEPTPGLSPLATYQDFLQRGLLAYQVETTTGRCVFYPRAAAGQPLTWRISAGQGRVHASTAVADREGVERNVSLVDLDEGFRMMTRVEGVAAREVAIGMRVKLRIFQPPQGPCYPVFDVVAA